MHKAKNVTAEFSSRLRRSLPISYSVNERFGFCAILFVLPGVIDPVLACSEQEDGDSQTDDEHELGQRGAVAHVLECKGLFVEIHHVEIGRAFGIAAAQIQYPGHNEKLQQTDDAQNQVIKDDRRHHGNRDRPQLTQEACAIDRCGFVQFRWYALQACQVDQDGIADAPETDEGVSEVDSDWDRPANASR